MSVQSGGNASVDTQALFQQFLGENQSEEISIQSGGDESLYSSIASDLMSRNNRFVF